MTLVGLSRVRKLRHLLLRPFSYERLKKITKRNNYRLNLDIYIPAMSTFAFKFIIFLYIPYRFLESIATFGYVKQFFRLL